MRHLPALIACLFLALPCAAAAGAAQNPIAGARLWVDPDSQAARDAERLRSFNPGESELLGRIADRPQAIWLVGGIEDVRGYVKRVMARATRARALPVFVLYNVPRRDCGGHSAGGAESAAAYGRWIRGVAAGIGRRRAVVVIEPDALAGIDCLSAERRRRRIALLRQAVRRLAAQPRVAVYLDAGHSGWQAPELMARRLRAAGVRRARGFSLNVANFRRTRRELAYGRRIAQLTGGKRFVIDTSRNGRGPAPGDDWCNPEGRALGAAPRTRRLPSRLVDALLWIKRPGESDGSCNGGPPAGQWWRDYALGLARRAG